MKILFINKFLYPNGGSETYIFKLGDYFKLQGHEVEFFGMDHKDRIVGNCVGSYTANMDFHTNKLQKILYPFKIIYSFEARKKIRKVLDDFRPDVVHLNNFNFQITPSIIYEIKKYRSKNRRKVKIIYTAHDYQLICPNHKMQHPISKQNCTKCIYGNYIHCIFGKCIHSSVIKSLLGTIEGYLYKILGTYQYIDQIICPSYFMEEKMKKNFLFHGKTTVLHNFTDIGEMPISIKKDYVIYFGRYSEEKGIKTLLRVCRELPNIPFIFAGSGPLEKEIANVANIKDLGFQNGDELKTLIREAKFSIYPSEWYENCPFSVMESQMYGTPVLAAGIGGIPELVENGKTGELFKSGDPQDLKKMVEMLWTDKEKCAVYAKNCRNIKFDMIDKYSEKLLSIYSK